MKRILTLIVTLVCVFAAYSQNTVYVWKGNTLSVQAADSLTIDRSTVGFVDLGLSVMWCEKNMRGRYSYFDASRNVDYGYRLPTKMEFYELFSRCTVTMYAPNTYSSLTLIGPSGKTKIMGATNGFLNKFTYSMWTKDSDRFYMNLKYIDENNSARVSLSFPSASNNQELQSCFFTVEK